MARNPSSFPPQREASSEIISGENSAKPSPLLEFPRDRPGPRDDEPPQDDDPNFSSLNPMGSTLLFPDSCRQRGFSVQKPGVGKVIPSCLPSLSRLSLPGKGKFVDRRQGRRAQKASAGKEFHPEIPASFRRKRRARRAPGGTPTMDELNSREKNSLPA